MYFVLIFIREQVILNRQILVEIKSQFLWEQVEIFQNKNGGAAEMQFQSKMNTHPRQVFVRWVSLGKMVHYNVHENKFGKMLERKQ